MSSLPASEVLPERLVDPRRKHLPEFDYFRGIAILMVLVAHATVKMEGTASDYFRALIVGGTNYFLFISGFFFYLIYRPNFSYIPFIIKRAKYVFLPFLVITLVALLVTPWISYVVSSEAPWDVFRAKLGAFLDVGRLYRPHWYVLFIMVLFLLSPLYLLYAKMGLRSMASVLMVMFVVSCLAHRPWPDADMVSLHGIIHFNVFYMFGIFYAKYRAKLDGHRGIIVGLGLVVAVIAIFQALPLNGPHRIFYHKQFWDYAGWDWMATQKAALCLPLVYLCCALRKGVVTSFLVWCAQLSFGFYLLHDPIYFYTKAVLRHLPINPNLTAPNTLLVSAITLLVGVTVSTLVIRLSRKLVGKNASRMLVGS